jgi:hypothetical protein
VPRPFPHEQHVAGCRGQDARLHDAERARLRPIDRPKHRDACLLAVHDVDKVTAVRQRDGPDVPEIAGRAIAPSDGPDRPTLDAYLGYAAGRVRPEQNDVCRGPCPVAVGGGKLSASAAVQENGIATRSTKQVGSRL